MPRKLDFGPSKLLNSFVLFAHFLMGKEYLHCLHLFQLLHDWAD